ncbi:myomesin-2-like [Glandiceps talaboti]
MAKTVISPLRQLFFDLSEEIGEDDEQKIRDLAKGQIKARPLEKLKNPTAIFAYLSDHVCKSEEDLLCYLKQLLVKIGRSPLIKDYIEVYEEEQKKALPGIPGTPNIIDVDANKVAIRWSEPEARNNTSITNYTIQRKWKEENEWTVESSDVDPKCTEFIVSGLTEGNTYQFRVAAHNAVGLGEYSKACNPTTTKRKYDVPSSPGKPITTEVCASKLTIQWSGPLSDGGRAVSNYVIERKDNIETHWKVVSRDVEPFDNCYVSTGLIEGRTYQFRVAAKNSEGIGSFSDLSDCTTTKSPYDVPGRPEQLNVLEINASRVTLEWSKPVSDGGSPILSYIIHKKDKVNTHWKEVSSDVDSGDTTFVVHSLVEGYIYQFRVAAKNAAGVGKYSVSDDIKTKALYGLPSAPIKPAVTDFTKNTATITWSEPESDGGSAITKYLIQSLENITNQWKTVTSVSYTELRLFVDGLIEGCTYQFRVAAQNMTVVGEFSEPSNPIVTRPSHKTPGAPGKPIVIGECDNKVTISWSSPVSDGGATISNYILQRMDHSNNHWVMLSPTIDPEKTIVEIDDLTDDHTYQFRVAARNSAGIGVFSEPSDAHMITQATSTETIPIWSLHGKVSGFACPRGISFIPGNKIVVADNNKMRLTIVDYVNGAYKVCEKINLKDHQLPGVRKNMRPWDTAVSTNDEIIFTDTANNQIVTLVRNTPSHKFTSIVQNPNIKPRGIAVMNDKIFFTDIKHNCVSVYERNGDLFTTIGREVGEFDNPMSVVVNSQNQIIVSDNENNRVQAFEINESKEAKLKFSYCPPDDHHKLLSPTGLAIDSCDNIYVCDSGNRRIVKLSPSGELIGYIDDRGLGRPLYISVTTDKNVRIAVTDSEAEDIKIYSMP